MANWMRLQLFRIRKSLTICGQNFEILDIVPSSRTQLLILDHKKVSNIYLSVVMYLVYNWGSEGSENKA